MNRFAARVRAALPWVAGALFLVAAIAVGRAIRRIGVAAVERALASLAPTDLVWAALLAAGSYLVLTLSDWLAVRTVASKRVGYPQAALASFLAVSVGHTVGFAALGSSAIRYRLYSHFGLGEVEIARVVVFSGVTVAVGLAGVAGAAGLVRPAEVADLAGVPAWIAAAVAGAGLIAVAAYVIGAAWARGSVRLFGVTHPLPSASQALLQTGIGCLNFVLVAAVLHRLLGESAGVSLVSFASFYAFGNVLSILTHVPGGFGVLEMVVLAALPGAEALGALIAFRVVYYFAPFVLGAVAYGAFELTRSRQARALARRPAAVRSDLQLVEDGHEPRR